MKTIVTIIPTNLISNYSLLSAFCLFLDTRNKNQIFGYCWSGNDKYYCFLFKVSHTLLQNHAEFNRRL